MELFRFWPNSIMLGAVNVCSKIGLEPRLTLWSSRGASGGLMSSARSAPPYLDVAIHLITEPSRLRL